MSHPFPTKYEMISGGISFIVSHILLSIGAFAFFSLYQNYDVYAVHNEEQVIDFHNAMSTTSHRTLTKIDVTLIWISFPLSILSLFTISKISRCIFSNTKVKNIAYLMEKAYLMWIVVSQIFCPALMLTSVSFEWSFHEFTPADDFVPTGYYIQLYITTFLFELVDCAGIADATFVISLTIFVGYVFFSTNPKLQQYRSVTRLKVLKKVKCCQKATVILFSSFFITIVILYCIVLFEFAETGFFSPTGASKFCILLVFIFKFIIGYQMISTGCSKKYEEVKQIFYGDQEILVRDTSIVNANDDTEICVYS